MLDLAIVIVSWNCREYLSGCLRSIASSGTQSGYTVIVVDNDSDDGTVAYVREAFPSVRIFGNTRNVGFAAANNQGMRGTQSRYVLLLNPDTVLQQGSLDAMIRFMDEHADAWAAGPAILNPDGSRQHSGVRFPSNWNIAVEAFFLDRLFPRSRLFGRHKELYEDTGRVRDVDYLQGSCLMVRADAIGKVGDLDEQFFMYFEETDWCYRMKRAGGKVVYCPAAAIVHFGGGETGHFDEPRLVYYHRSLVLFYRKHYSTGKLVILRPLLVIRSLLRLGIWCAVAAVRPTLRRAAVSSVKGYTTTLVELFRWGETVQAGKAV
jgi:GT2 family glycosyltransferase